MIASLRAAGEALESDRGHTPFGGAFWRHVEERSKEAEAAAAAGATRAGATAVTAGATLHVDSAEVRLQAVLEHVADRTPELVEHAKAALAVLNAQDSDGDVVVPS